MEIQEWAVKIAEAAAPHEVELAPMIIQAYVAGGEARKELDAPSGSTVGAFGSGELVMVLPAILATLSSIAPYVLQMLNSKTTAESLGCVKTILGIVELGQRAKNLKPGKPVAPRETIKALVPGDEAYVSLRRVLEIMPGVLQQSGIKELESEGITLRVMRALLENPSAASEFVQQVSKAHEQ